MHRYSYILSLLAAVACNIAEPPSGAPSNGDLTRTETANDEQSFGILESALSTAGHGRRGRDHGRPRARHGRRHRPPSPPRCEPADAGAPISDEVAESCCGVPGDRGNELGVGKFCTRDEHCAGNAAATLCSSIENDITDHKSFYCTIPCDPNQLENICGEGASCICEEVGCACTPTSCVENPPNDCEEP